MENSVFLGFVGALYEPFLGFLGGGEIGKVGAHNPIVFLYRSSSRHRPVCGFVENAEECRAAYGRGKHAATSHRPSGRLALGYATVSGEQPALR